MNLLKRRYPSYLLLAIVAIAALLATGCAAAAGAQGGPGNDEDAVKSVGLTSGSHTKRRVLMCHMRGRPAYPISGQWPFRAPPDIACCPWEWESSRGHRRRTRSAEQ